MRVERGITGEGFWVLLQTPHLRLRSLRLCHLLKMSKKSSRIKENFCLCAVEESYCPGWEVAVRMSGNRSWGLHDDGWARGYESGSNIVRMESVTASCHPRSSNSF